ncbi:MAG TPA: NAD(P)/FAD-dependent oxidoreductase [Propionibacteriaceae bacterium]|nr:NAD(P)/FAD-dependent oxidoreductase [Propionibacteriaceae bacterium]
MSRYDVVVVGGRVAGASTALLLACSGVRVILIDRDRYGSDTLSTHGLMRAGVLQLHRWGVLPDVLAAGTPPIREVIFSYSDGERTSIAIRPSAGVGALFAPRRYLLDRLLVDAAAAAGVEIRHETSVTALLRDSVERVVGVRVRRRLGGSAGIQADLTVGADGVRSTVADQVDAPVEWRGVTASAFLYRYFHDLPTAGYEWFYGDHAAAGLIPTNDGTCVFVATTPAGLRTLRRSGAEQAFALLLASAAPALVNRIGAATPVSRLHGWAGTPGYLRRCWGPGWALVGDAGYFKDPITTHGMTDALRDAELLADAVLDALSGAPSAAPFTAYQHTRDRLSRQLFDTTEAVAAYDWDLDQVRRLLRQVSAAMGDEVDHLEALPATPNGVPAGSHRG